jgi:hypothetical protein
LDNLEDMDKFLDVYNLSWRNIKLEQTNDK